MVLCEGIFNEEMDVDVDVDSLQSAMNAVEKDTLHRTA